MESPVTAAVVETRAAKTTALPSSLSVLLPSVLLSDHLTVDREILIKPYAKEKSMQRFQQKLKIQKKCQTAIGVSENGVLYRT